MKAKSLSPLLTFASSLLLLPAGNAAGMIVIDPIVGGMPRIIPTVRPGVHPQPRTTPTFLKGAVSFGLRLQDSDVRVDIVDQIAKTYITQTFVNDTDRNLAGTYLFPLPEDTTFSSFSLHIDGKPVEGKILEAQEARQQYEEIVRRMVDPGLLEYANEKTVRARIFPIPAHGTKKVELEYTQILKAENGMIKYRFPLKAEGESATSDEVKINVKIGSKQGLRTIWSPSHTISAKREGDHKAQISFLGKDMVPDKDFFLYYSVSDKDLATNLLNHRNADEDGYFLLTVTPPMQAKELIHKDIVFVADCSGSMQGQRMDQNKKALKYLVNALNPNDRFSIVAFNTDVDMYKSRLMQATAENKKAASSFIDDLNAAGGTNIGDALKSASTMLGGAKERPSYLILMTDGEPTVGETSIAGLVKAVDSKKDIRLFDFGVGYDVNTTLLNKLADVHHGTSEYVEPNESLEVALSNFYDKVKSPVLSNIKISYDNIQVKDVYPRNVRDIFAGSQVMLMGRYKGSGTANVQLTGSVNGVQKAYSFPLKFEAAEAGHTYLPRLWAMRRIAHLTEVAHENGENREIIEEIVALSKKFGIISAYTSFLVTDPSEPARVATATPVPLQHGDSREANVRGSMIQMMAVNHGKAIPRKAQMAPSPWNTGMTDALAGATNGVAGGGGFAEGQKKMEAELGRLTRDFNSPASGKDAVKRAKEMSKLKQSLAMHEEKNDKGGIKIVEDKTFYLHNGIWTDSSFEQSKSPKPEMITFATDEYFNLLKRLPGIAKYLSVGKEVIINYKGHCYQIVLKSQA